MWLEGGQTDLSVLLWNTGLVQKDFDLVRLKTISLREEFLYFSVILSFK